jgi:septum site-determining protein MinC
VTSSDSQHAPDLFVTETMAELSARQGRTADAIAIYRSLLGGAAPGDERRTRWTARLATLEGGIDSASEPAAPAPVATAVAAPAPREESAPAARPESALRLPLVVRQPVRSGQIVYAQQTDLIVLAAVNPGAQLLADGNIHVYAPLRGRAVAGVRGARDAQIFCLRLDAELVGVDAAYLVSEDIPSPLRGQAVRVWRDPDERRCRVERLSVLDARPPH